MDVKSAVRKAISGAAKARGYEVIPFWKIDNYPLASHLREVFDRHAIEVVIDVGANMGQYHDFLREDVGFDGRIVSFEPVRKYVDMLAARLPGDPRWSLHDVALGSAESTATINVTRSPGLNSILAPRTDIVTGYWDEQSITGTETIRVRSLDEVLAEAGIDCAATPVYLKLDTQGYDLQVVAGAARSLPFVRAMQTEASIRPIYQDMPSWADTIATMTAHRFEPSGMFPVTRDAHLRLVELDLVFVNGALLEQEPGERIARRG